MGLDGSCWQPVSCAADIDSRINANKLLIYNHSLISSIVSNSFSIFVMQYILTHTEFTLVHSRCPVMFNCHVIIIITVNLYSTFLSETSNALNVLV